ncbi:MAG: beta-lactamase family protein [Deltaproteobacteria bacterium]|nr:beta-lactamase family protein [Deltaproteobacteria bacterium]
MKKADTLMKQAVTDNVFPGSVLLVSKKNEVVFFEAYGRANIDTKLPMKRETLFDLASLTKPLATTLAVMKLIQQSRLALEQMLGAVLPVFKNTKKEHITIRQLLSHSSGLPDHKPYYLKLRKLPVDERRAGLREFLVKEPLISPIGEKALYSDLGFMILCWVVESVSKNRLDHFVADEIYQPLGINTADELFFVDLGLPPRKAEFAATELCPWRKILLNGVVHDDNAYAAGGIEGHAGLFGKASAVNSLLLELLSVFNGHSETQVFQKELVHTFFQKQGESDMALGFDTPSEHHSSCGDFFSKKSVGHLGFTGTSFWIDLERSILVILLSNRVHPHRRNEKIKAFRPVLHNAVMQSLMAS